MIVAALAAYVIAVSVAIALYLIFRDSLEEFRGKLQWTLAELHWTIGWKTALLVRLRVPQTCKSAISGLVVQSRRQRRLVYGLLARVQRRSDSAIAGWGAKVRQRRVYLDTRLVRIRREGEVTIVRLVTEFRRQLPLMSARLVRAQRAGGSTIAGCGERLRWGGGALLHAGLTRLYRMESNIHGPTVA